MPSRCFLRVPKGQKALSTLLPTGLLSGCSAAAGSLWADLSPSDFHLFGYIKKVLPVLRFAVDLDVKQAAA